MLCLKESTVGKLALQELFKSVFYKFFLATGYHPPLTKSWDIARMSSEKVGFAPLFFYKEKTV